MTNLAAAKIGFIGFGNMASSMACGLLRAGDLQPSQLYVCAAHYDALCERTRTLHINACHDARELVGQVNLVILAIKPYLIDELLDSIASELDHVALLSVAAGWNAERYRARIPNAQHISCIPNTPVSICEGTIALEEAHTLNPENYALVRQLLDSLGHVVELDSSLLSVAGTIAGCGPAFIAMVIEALGDAGVKHGLPRSKAYELASQMIAGTARLQRESGVHPAAMKDAVCSPGGTTIRGVAALEAAGVRHAFIRAIDAIEQ